MPVYWLIFALGLLFFGFQLVFLRPPVLLCHRTSSYYKKEALLFAIPLVTLWVFLTFRDQVLDTYAYVAMFKNLPVDIVQLESLASDTAFGYGFTWLAGLFKIFVKDDHYWWFGFLAFINLFCVMKVCLKHSPDFGLSVYLFIAGAFFTWCLNGTRQFLAVTVLFYFSKWMLENKKILYIALILLMSTIHKSAIFLIPIVCFVSVRKVYGVGMVIILLVTIVGTMFSDDILSEASEIVGKDYGDAFEEGKGSSVLRLMVTCVPTFLTMFYLKKIRREATPPVILAINMSLVGACFMFAATFTNGILVGRMPAYFTLYNLYLLPWLIYHCFHHYRWLVTFMCVVLYAVLFYFQMCVAWGGLPYVSEYLGIYYASYL